MQKSNNRAQNAHSGTRSRFASAMTLTGATLALTLTATLTATTAQAQITQDCILEGTVDMRKAEQLGQPMYVKFRNARNGPEANCNMNRRSKSRRVQFVSSPDTSVIENAAHGDKVRYRYIERENQSGKWELMDPEGRL